MKNSLFKYGFACLALFSISISSSCAATYKLYKTSEHKYVEAELAFDEIARSQVVVLGETHYEGRIQEAEGWALEKLSLREPSFQMAWEFLDTADQAKIQSSFDEYVRGDLSGEQWLNLWFSSSSADHTLYLPMYEVAKNHSQKVLGTNVSRVLKKRLMDNGRDLLLTDREVWPFSSTVADAPLGYYQRFEGVMGGHADTQTLEKYYLAQFYTDAFMANSIVDQLSEGPIMMVVGHFHSDYGHGLPFYLSDLGVKDMTNIRIIDSADISADELESSLEDHSSYGALGDYILIID